MGRTTLKRGVVVPARLRFHKPRVELKVYRIGSHIRACVKFAGPPHGKLTAGRYGRPFACANASNPRKAIADALRGLAERVDQIPGGAFAGRRR